MKYFTKFLLAFVFLLSCHTTHKPANKQPVFDFDAWKSKISLDFNNMVEAEGVTNPQKKINKQMISQEINILEKRTFKYNFIKANSENKIQKWQSMYIIYHFLEGEFNQGLSSYIFFTKKKYWGITYDHNSQKYFQINSNEAYIINEIKSQLYGGGNGIAIISKFDNQMNNINNVIVAGVSYSEALAPLMKIYDEKIFY